jgi:hypothetical protein
MASTRNVARKSASLLATASSVMTGGVKEAFGMEAIGAQE